MMNTSDRQGEYNTIAHVLAHAKRRFNPHDLLWTAEGGSFIYEEALPDWASSEWLCKAPAVIRRERVATPGYLPVGLRGRTREQRHKAYVRHDCVSRWVTPEMLSQAPILDDALRLGRFAALDTLLKIAPVFNALRLAWGPTGSVGFALASGISVLRPSSDLDLLVRASEMLDIGTVKILRAVESHANCRLDIQIDTGRGAFSFAEWAQGKRNVLLKTDGGPILTDAPWGERTGMAERFV